MDSAPPSGRRSDPERLEAFSDGVMAVIITFLAFDLQEPAKSSFHSLEKSLPSLLVYILSFTFIGIYWNNHHHLLRSTERISAAVMWSNLHLLFWLSLIPVLTKWMAHYYGSHLPACVYGVVGLGAAIAYSILVRAIIASNGLDSQVAQAIGDDRKGYGSIVLYILGAAMAWVSPWIAYALFAAVSVIWFVPDRRLDRGVEAAEG